jgi:hypothetical protein
MFEQLLANNAKSTLATAISSSSTASLVLQTGHGARFPTVQSGDFFNVTLDDGTNVEICRCIAISGDTLTVLRGVEGTTAQSSFAITVTRVELRMTADVMRQYALRRRGDIKEIRPNLNAITWTAIGLAVPTAVNTLVAAALTNSSYREQQERIRMTNANSANDGFSLRVANRTVCGQKGYRWTSRFGFAIVPNSSHFFIGLTTSTGAMGPLFPPSSLTNAIAIGWDNAGSLQGTFLNIYAVNSNASTLTKLTLSSYFNVNTQAWYEFELYNQPGAARVDYTVRRLDVSSIPDVTSYFASGIPDSSLWLSPQMCGASMVTSAMAVEVGPMWWVG